MNPSSLSQLTAADDRHRDDNPRARHFYEKFGFVAGEEVQDYYKRIDPPHAVVLRKVPPFDAW